MEEVRAKSLLITFHIENQLFAKVEFNAVSSNNKQRKIKKRVKPFAVGGGGGFNVHLDNLKDGENNCVVLVVLQ